MLVNIMVVHAAKAVSTTWPNLNITLDSLCELLHWSISRLWGFIIVCPEIMCLKMLPVTYMSAFCQWKSCCSAVTCVKAERGRSSCHNQRSNVKPELCPMWDTFSKLIRHREKSKPPNVNCSYSEKLEIDIFAHSWKILWLKKSGFSAQLSHLVTGLKTTIAVTATEALLWSICSRALDHMNRRLICHDWTLCWLSFNPETFTYTILWNFCVASPQRLTIRWK